MATQNRTALINKMHKVLKKHYKPVPTPDRPTLEHVLYACCLENASYDAADKAYTAVSTTFFDWNEVRVSTVKELAEVMHTLPEPAVAAGNLKRVLQSVFEASYSFELEALKKLPLGQAQQKLQKHPGVTSFTVAYVTQAALGGHAIPLDRGLLDAFGILGLASEQEKAAHSVPGLERAIPKNKGVEFGSLAHQLGAELIHSPHSQNLHKILLEIAPDCKERLPKRGSKPAKPLEAAPATDKNEKAAPAASAEPAHPAKAAAHSEGAKTVKAGASVDELKPGKSKAPVAGKKTSTKKDEPPAKPAAPEKTPHKSTAAKSAAAKPGSKAKPSAAGMAKRKPR
jgi:endonuclease III